MEDFFDLTLESNDIDKILIGRVDNFNCALVDSARTRNYAGFILAKSPHGNKLTVCDVGFQRSTTDGKFQPRLTFRRTNQNLEDSTPPSSSDHIRLSFATGQDGYRNFWKMIFFLYKFKESVDFGEFENKYQVLTGEQLVGYLNDKENLEKIRGVANELDIEVSTILRPVTTINILKEYRWKLNEFIVGGSSETDVQHWIDEGGHKFRTQRCLIFGLEYIDFKREGSSSSKRFDVLTRVGTMSLERVLIELKSPRDDIFELNPHETINDPTFEYRLHKELSRAIPQILEYKSSLEGKPAGDPELEKLGFIGKAKICKCIVVIGKSSENQRWLKNRENIAKSLNSSLEIWTYTDLLSKLDSTIENLESNILPEEEL